MVSKYSNTDLRAIHFWTLCPVMMLEVCNHRGLILVQILDGGKTLNGIKPLTSNVAGKELAGIGLRTKSYILIK